MNGADSNIPQMANPRVTRFQFPSLKMGSRSGSHRGREVCPVSIAMGSGLVFEITPLHRTK